MTDTLLIATDPDHADRLLSATAGPERTVSPPGRSAIAGGTDLLVQRRAGRQFPTLVDLSGLPGPAAWVETDGTLALSATAGLTMVDRAAGGQLPALRAAIAAFAGRTIRNRATIGGNLATGSPAADTVPALVVAGAVVRLRSLGGARRVPITDFLLGPRRVDLRPGEWISSVSVPVRGPVVGGMRKVAGRRAQAISLVSLAWQWRRDAGGRISRVRLAMGAVAPTVVRLPAVEAALEGTRITADAVKELVPQLPSLLTGAIDPIDDLRAGADYRRRCAAGLLHELLAAQLADDREGESS